MVYLTQEDVEAWHGGDAPRGSGSLDVAAKACRLVLFDSVALAHEVLPVLKGQRLVLAGWFHERTLRRPARVEEEEEE